VDPQIRNIPAVFPAPNGLLAVISIFKRVTQASERQLYRHIVLDTPDWGGGTEIATGEKSAGYTDKNKDLRQKTQKYSRHTQTMILLLLIPNVLTSLLPIMSNRPFGRWFSLKIEVSKISTGSRCDAQTAKCLTVYTSLS